MTHKDVLEKSADAAPEAPKTAPAVTGARAETVVERRLRMTTYPASPGRSGHDTTDAGGTPAAHADHDEAARAIDAARSVLATEERSLRQLAASIGAPFAKAVGLLAGLEGRVVVTGMGKSGHIGRKIAATLASTGTPAMFVHPAEASHGDLGMITRADAVLALSNSGETAELRDITLYAGRFAIPLVAMVGRASSTLADAAEVALVLPPIEEACPLGLAPTSSTTCMLALGDALAVALLHRRGFTPQDFAVFHPGGKLGSRLLRVEDLMHAGADLPLVDRNASVADALMEMTGKRLGCVGVRDTDGRLAGIVTDGDLRRHMSEGILGRNIAEIMTAHPRIIGPRALAVEALHEMNEGGSRRITVLFVVDEGRPVGAIHLHDCLRAGIA